MRPAPAQSSTGISGLTDGLTNKRRASNIEQLNVNQELWNQCDTAKWNLFLKLTAYYKIHPT